MATAGISFANPGGVGGSVGSGVGGTTTTYFKCQEIKIPEEKYHYGIKDGSPGVGSGGKTTAIYFKCQEIKIPTEYGYP